jgi:hypothetical protein
MEMSCQTGGCLVGCRTTGCRLGGGQVRAECFLRVHTRTQASAGAAGSGGSTAAVGRTNAVALTSAPFSTRSLAAADWLLAAVSCSGVNPCAPAGGRRLEHS